MEKDSRPIQTDPLPGIQVPLDQNGKKFAKVEIVSVEAGESTPVTVPLIWLGSSSMHLTKT